jgi:DNA-binding NtrC family response regulator
VLHEVSEARRIAAFLREHSIEAVAVADDVAGTNLLDTEQIDALICETRAPRIDGLRLLRISALRNPDICTILVATPENVGLATRAMEEGAHDFQTRPLNLEKIYAVIRRGLAAQKTVREMHELVRRLDRKFGFQNLIGSSGQIVRVYNRILQVCGLDAPVLITGESGTGRELVASAIHHNSPRRAGPLVRMDCESLETHVLEEELFGRDPSADGRGARAGRIELAAGGTLVLERIDELPPTTQGRLLRLLRDSEYERDFGTRPVRADVRVIAIAPPDLRARVEEGRFRADLHDHLRSVALDLPALRHRRRDIPLLAEHFLMEAREESNRAIAGIQPAAMDRLVRYEWPGNVRELKSVIRGMVLTAAGDGPLDIGDLPEEIRRAGVEPAGEIRVSTGTSLGEVERRLIEATLVQQHGDRAATARILGIGLRTLQRRLASYAGRPRTS